MPTSFSALSTRRPWRASVRVEVLALGLSLFFTVVSNGLFWGASLAGRAPTQPATWIFAGGLAIAIAAIHFILFCLVFNRWTARPLSALLLLVTAFAAYYMGRYTVFLDPSMLRNVLRTDVREASELFSLGMIPHLLLTAGLPLLVLSRVHIRRDATWRRAIAIRLSSLLLAVLVGAGALLWIFQDVAPLMRNHKEVRYLITPANYLYSLVNVLGADANAATRPRVPVGRDAVKAERWQQRSKPVLFVVVVGETARAANWGLSGYARQTTPELAQRDVINFNPVTSCGTNTEVSVPCLFSVYGRRNYDEGKIRSSESLLNVLERAGLKVLWRENQSGCKGVCDGVESETLTDAKQPEWCDGERCLDEILLQDLDKRLADRPGSLVLVLHQLGNHGPAYYKRYPPALRRFEPVCETSDLAKCSRESVVNAYDNALLYTDHMLARTIDVLKAHEAQYDTAMLYVSDHGESLGENGLYLHGIPYSIAPKEQTRVPMVMWFSPGYARSFSLDTDCLRRRATQPAAHDNVFHSILGLLEIRTAVYDPAMDLTAGCRRP